MADVIRSVLFVDFDNVFFSLQSADKAAARNFANDPQGWLDAIETGALIDGGEGARTGVKRRILMRRCYANPAVMRYFRSQFTRSGFQIVDCPPLTGRGKNSADIYMVVDMLDALRHETRFDEFIIMSGDADFTPVLMRLRAHDRQSVIYLNAVTAAAYKSLCDGMITEEGLIDLVDGDEGAEPVAPPPVARVERRDEPQPLRRDEPIAVRPERRDEAPAGRGPERRIEPKFEAMAGPAIDGETAARIGDDIIAAVTRAIDQSAEPVSLAALASEARSSVGRETVETSRWGGFGSFRNLLSAKLPEGYQVTGHSPGWVFDRRRHTPPGAPNDAQDQAPSDGVNAGFRLPRIPDNLFPLVRRVNAATNVPSYAPEVYAALFRALAAEIAAFGFSFNRTVNAVGHRMTATGMRLRPPQIAFVVKGLMLSGHEFGPDDTPATLAKAFRRQVLFLCANEDLTLSESERSALGAWLVGGLRSVPQSEVMAPEEVTTDAAVAAEVAGVAIDNGRRPDEDGMGLSSEDGASGFVEELEQAMRSEAADEAPRAASAVLTEAGDDEAEPQEPEEGLDDGDEGADGEPAPEPQKKWGPKLDEILTRIRTPSRS